MGRLGAGTLLAYGLPSLPLAAVSIPLVVYLPALYSRQMGLDLGAIGGLLLLARLWDVITDPLIGLASDHTPGRFGRRRPWLIAGTPLVMLAIWRLFLPPEGSTALDFFLYALVLYLGWTMITLPHQAWGAELSPDYHQRTRIAGFREAAQIAGIMLAAALPLMAADAFEDLSGGPLRLLAYGTILVLPVVVLLAVVLVPDGPLRETTGLRWRDGLAVLLGNRPFRRLVGAYLLNGLANGLPATLFYLFVSESLQEPEAAPVLLFAYFFTGVLATPAWVVLSYRIGKHRAWAASMLWNALVFLAVPLLGPGDATLFLVVCILSGLCLGADLTLPAAIQADVVDADAVAAGERRTGLYFALWGMATKLALGLSVGIALPLLSLLGLVVGQANSSLVLLALALLYAGVPILCKLTAAAMVWNFPLDERRQAELRRQLQNAAE